MHNHDSFTTNIAISTLLIHADTITFFNLQQIYTHLEWNNQSNDRDPQSHFNWDHFDDVNTTSCNRTAHHVTRIQV